jgi:hypothetical protein
MITFSASITEALRSFEVRSPLPTTLSSEQLGAIDPDILRRAFFMARVMSAELLQTVQDIIDQLLAGEIDFATARLLMRDKLSQLGHVADAEEAGKITDLASDARLNLVLRINVAQARGYGQWLQSQRALDAAPAQELYRAYPRRVPRNWIARWSQAGGTFYNGKMVALVNDDIWKRISRFNTPYPPFDFNSGMSVRSVDRQTAIDAGLTDRDTQFVPEYRSFNEDLQMTPEVRDAALKQVLVEDGYHFTEDGVLTL